MSKLELENGNPKLRKEINALSSMVKKDPKFKQWEDSIQFFFTK